MLDFDGSMKSNVSMTLHGNCKLVALELHNSCSYIVVIELQKLHMYTIIYDELHLLQFMQLV
jgi:hypothetical protein